MNGKKFLRIFCFVAIVTLAIIGLRMCDKDGNLAYQSNVGSVFGTTYSITYEYKEDLSAEIQKTMKDVDFSLSPFNDSSVITQINNNKEVVLDKHFVKVFETAMKVSEETEGAFDITVAPLVNAWGFGFKTKQMPSQQQVDSLLQLVGYKKIKKENGKIVKENPNTMLDCSAIAKGYGVDAVADMLKEKGIKNFMVEIGGEVVTQGVNSKQAAWRIGIVEPTDDSLSIENEIKEVLEVQNMAMATSGNYRKFYVKDGKKYAHTIDPKSGFPVQHNILSATVLGPTCTVCDAYATSFMVMGLDGAKKVLDRHPELMAYLIYNNDKGENKVWHSPKLKKLLGK